MLRLLVLVALLAGPVAAQTYAPPSAPPFLTDVELEGSRGGFTILDGQDLSFSAVMRSYVDGRLVLESRLSVGEQGRLLSSTASGAPLVTSTLEGLAAAGLTLGASADGGQLYVSEDRQTVFLHRAGDSQIASLLVNTANQRDLRQETSLVLDLPGFELTQSAMREGLAARALADDIRAALTSR